jgi:hypothetical protein
VIVSARGVPDGKVPADVVREHLAVYMGAFTSRNAVQLMAKQIAGTAPEALTLMQIPALLDALGPMLRTLLGKAGADKVIGEVRWKLDL